MNEPINLFGTDGFRGRTNEAITPANTVHFGNVAGQVLLRHGYECVVIAKDTRKSGYMLETAIQSGLLATGINVELTGPLPTPALAMLVRSRKKRAGLMISASHNPHHDNGIKLLGGNGMKIPTEIEAEIQSLWESEDIVVESDELGNAERLNDSRGRYIEFCKSTLGRMHKSYEDIRMVLDCAHGACYAVSPDVFSELGVDLDVIGNEPDGININNECGSTDVQMLVERTLKKGADIGVALDGDGDRIAVVSKSGQVLDGDDLLYILATNATEKVERVVTTVIANSALDHALGKHGIEVIRSQVGDRNVVAKMMDTGTAFGGEPSGHIILGNLLWSSDGTIAALRLMQIMAERNCGIDDLLEGFDKYPALASAVPRAPEHTLEVIHSAEKQLAELYENKPGRIIIRPSGTEKVVRLVVEADTETEAKKRLDHAEQFIADLRS